eukprot:CAMPEP_0203989028 /NCGR_PEP_ID=MMETSP0360-20130528/7820_1 /ASSEMBLY_ACC=CAM_ASM_000342 /TAXON_ID=268821 /ORGANISM="Scrippsiella Hangoei, Strain SHTV-5" /LENGTH=61 /DNA_ID=CAMNT_0050928861 /DNA_START=235 /DNA_END=417 /DNA_ORIENTATION=+
MLLEDIIHMSSASAGSWIRVAIAEKGGGLSLPNSQMWWLHPGRTALQRHHRHALRAAAVHV